MDIIYPKGVEETSKQTTDQIKSINKLFLKLQDKKRGGIQAIQ
jgi:hypothetical protein